MDNQSANDRYDSLPELSQYSRLGQSTLRKYIRLKGLPAYKVGGKVIVKRSEFDAWMKGFRLNREANINTIANDVLKSVRG
jgi:excisionase family DNA binding protein